MFSLKNVDKKKTISSSKSGFDVLTLLVVSKIEENLNLIKKP
jgi:hypothetical protein